MAAINRSPPGPSGTNARPGFVQNCPAPRVTEPASPAPISAARSAAAAGGDHDRVEAAELAEERDRIGPAVDDGHQRAGARGGAGEPGGANGGVGHEVGAGLHAVHDAEGAGGRADAAGHGVQDLEAQL